jgi:peptidoglycan hydrolase-like protein with peptidoglycan-binding domain
MDGTLGGKFARAALVVGMEFLGQALPLSSDGLAAAADVVGGDVAALWTVITVETMGCGFLPDRRPRILFERHIFSARTNRRFDASHPHISGPPGAYGLAGAHQYERLAAAASCDRRAALESASWGLGQIMGFNATPAGFRDVEDLASRMSHYEDEQILGMARFMRTSGMHNALQRRDWTAFARSYNGPNFAINRYDQKLAVAYASLGAGKMPDLNVRAAQLLLTYHGFDPGPVDGFVGDKTNAAIAAFAARHSLPALPAGHGDLHAALRERLPPLEEKQPQDAPSATPRAAAADLQVVQLLLSFLGHDPGPSDGKPGPRTQSAIADFLRSQGESPSGAAGAVLLDALKAEAMREFGKNQIRDTRLVQQVLNVKGFDAGAADGLLGPRTKKAIIAFQEKQEMPMTGGINKALACELLLGGRISAS